jgi:hypothetical protein
VQELFIVVRDLILETKKKMVSNVAAQLNLTDSLNESSATKSGNSKGKSSKNEEADKDLNGVLESKLQSVFKDYSMQIFKYSEDQIKSFLEDKYRPRCMPLFEEADDEDGKEMFEDNVGTPDFVRFVQAIIKLQLHMVLNDPPIELSMLSKVERD